MSDEAAAQSAGGAQPHPQESADADLIRHCRHALRTPLNAILGFAQILGLDRDQPLSAVQKQRVDQIQAAGWQLLQMIDEAVELARIAGTVEPIGGRLQVHHDPVSGSELRLVTRAPETPAVPRPHAEDPPRPRRR
jgi:signal transduction histidine kinase